jgi:hypothetical protein
MLFFSELSTCLATFLFGFGWTPKLTGIVSAFDTLTIGVLGFASLPRDKELGFEGCLLSGD